MKLNKTFGRIATTLVATAMLASLAAPAYANSFSGGVIDGEVEVNTISFSKELIRPDYVATPNVTFTFTMTGQKGGETVTDQADASNEDYHSVVTEDAYVDGSAMIATGTVTFGGDGAGDTVTGQDNGTTDTDQMVTVTDTVNIDISGLTFTKPGVYKFSLTESSSDPSNSAYTLGIDDDNPYSVYLFVEDRGDNGIIVTGAELVKGNQPTNAAENKVDKITNYYMVDPETGIVPNSLTVDKTVTGTMGDKNAPFNFTVTITATGNRTFSASKGDTSIDVVEGDADNTYVVSTTLKDGESVTINGLLNGDSYVVKEAEAGKDGYTTMVAGAANADSHSVVFDDEAADTVSYTNHRDAVSPTGLVMDIAPYALLVVVAAAGCFVFLRKRRED